MRRGILPVLAVLWAACVTCPDVSLGAGGKKPTTMPVPNIVGKPITDISVGIGASGRNIGGGGEAPSLSPRERFERLMADAQNLYDKGKYFDARDRADSARLLMTDSEQAKRVLDMFTRINKAGQSMLEAYQKSFEQKNYVEALKGFGLVSRTFGTLPCAANARRVLDNIKKDPEIQKALREVKAEELDATVDQLAAGTRKVQPPKTGPTSAPADNAAGKSSMPARADRIRALPLEQAQRAVATLETIVKLYADTDTGAKDKDELDTIKADKKFISALEQYHRDGKARSLLDTAASYVKMGQFDAARKNYGQVIKEFPGTDWAAKANKALAKLNKE